MVEAKHLGDARWPDQALPPQSQVVLSSGLLPRHKKIPSSHARRVLHRHKKNPSATETESLRDTSQLLPQYKAILLPHKMNPAATQEESFRNATSIHPQRIDRKTLTIHNARPFANRKSKSGAMSHASGTTKPADKSWKTILHEHHDFFLAPQHPSAGQSSQGASGDVLSAGQDVATWNPLASRGFFFRKQRSANPR